MQFINQTIMPFATRWWLASVAIIVVAAFLQAATEGKVIYQDALIALCVMTVALVETIRQRQWLGVAGAVGGIASSYLWLANGMEISPVDRYFATLVLLTFLVALLTSLGPAIMVSSSPNILQTAATGFTAFFAISGAIFLVIWFLLP